MAGIRGDRPFMPRSGMKPTGIFSTNGRQKRDRAGPNASMTAKAMDMPRKGPKKRNNMLRNS